MNLKPFIFYLEWLLLSKIFYALIIFATVPTEESRLNEPEVDKTSFIKVPVAIQFVGAVACIFETEPEITMTAILASMQTTPPINNIK